MPRIGGRRERPRLPARGTPLNATDPLRLDRLIAEHGADFPGPALLRILAGDCPRREASLYERCDVYFPNVPTVF